MEGISGVRFGRQFEYGRGHSREASNEGALGGTSTAVRRWL